jgi:hypothetical protein
VHTRSSPTYRCSLVKFAHFAAAVNPRLHLFIRRSLSTLVAARVFRVFTFIFTHSAHIVSFVSREEHA